MTRRRRSYRSTRPSRSRRNPLDFNVSFDTLWDELSPDASLEEKLDIQETLQRRLSAPVKLFGPGRLLESDVPRLRHALVKALGTSTMDIKSREPTAPPKSWGVFGQFTEKGFRFAPDVKEAVDEALKPIKRRDKDLVTDLVAFVIDRYAPKTEGDAVYYLGRAEVAAWVEERRKEQNRAKRWKASTDTEGPAILEGGVRQALSAYTQRSAADGFDAIDDELKSEMAINQFQTLIEQYREALWRPDTRLIFEMTASHRIDPMNPPKRWGRYTLKEVSRILNRPVAVLQARMQEVFRTEAFLNNLMANVTSGHTTVEEAVREVRKKLGPLTRVS